MNNGNPETSTPITGLDAEPGENPAELALLGPRPDLAALYQRYCQLSLSN